MSCYQEFVKQNYSKVKGNTPQEKMKALGSAWRKSKTKTGGGLTTQQQARIDGILNEIRQSGIALQEGKEGMEERNVQVVPIGEMNNWYNHMMADITEPAQLAATVPPYMLTPQGQIIPEYKYVLGKHRKAVGRINKLVHRRFTRA